MTFGTTTVSGDNDNVHFVFGHLTFLAVSFHATKYFFYNSNSMEDYSSNFLNLF